VCRLTLGATKKCPYTKNPAMPIMSRLDVIDDQLYGPGHNEASRQRLHAQQDQQAIAEWEATEAAERAAAAAARLSENEIFEDGG